MNLQKSLCFGLLLGSIQSAQAVKLDQFPLSLAVLSVERNGSAAQKQKLLSSPRSEVKNDGEKKTNITPRRTQSADYSTHLKVSSAILNLQFASSRRQVTLRSLRSNSAFIVSGLNAVANGLSSKTIR